MAESRSREVAEARSHEVTSREVAEARSRRSLVARGLGELSAISFRLVGCWMARSGEVWWGLGDGLAEFRGGSVGSVVESAGGKRAV